ncbi:MAG TPA: two-component regulator propeller domain-containing protein, partial [Bacillota bacterium]|nr:two-component regulator propeller domain-containing protein [Bacillota bacterium]
MAATNSTYSVKVWDTEDGLPQSAVLALTQTRDGYLWVGTLDGLARFDGTRFTTFNEANTPELTSSRIVKLFEDSRGELWIGTESAGVFVVQNGKIKSVDIGRGTSEGRLMAICEDAKGAIWFYTANGQLCRYQDNRGDVWNAGSAFPSRCRALAIEGNLLWVGNDWSLSALGPVPAGSSVGLPVAQELRFQRLDFLLASRRGGAWRLADGRLEKWNASRKERDLGAYPWTNSVPVVAACEDLEGNLVVGTYGDGVYWFDAEGHFTHLLNELSHGSILSLTVDREGCLWIGTNGGGLNRVKRQVFRVLPSSTNSTVQSVCEDAQGGLWIGYNGERVDHLTLNGLQQFTNFQDKATGPPKYYVKSLFMDCDQQLWAGTHVGGLLQFQAGRFQPAPGWQRLSTVSTNLSNSQLSTLNSQLFQDVSALYQDRSHRLWVGTQAGLAMRDEDGWQLQTNALLTNAVRAIAEDRAGNLWVGTEGSGLARLHAGQVSRFGKTEGLPSDNISALYVDNDDILWVGTSSGLARLQAGKCTSYAGQGGLVTRSIGYLLEDGQGCLWIGSNGGLLRVRKQDLNDFAAGRLNAVTVRSFGKADGLPTRECTQGSQPAACRTRDGRLWFPTIKGLVSINPTQLQPNTNPPPVIIESVLVDGHAQGATNALRPAPPQTVTVRPGKQTLEINFTSLNLSAPEEVRFQYRLEGLENDWIPSTAR